MVLIEDATYYNIDYPNDYFSLKVCGKKGTRIVRDLRADLNLNTVRELQIIASYLQIFGRSKLNKSELIDAIKKTKGKRQCC